MRKLPYEYLKVKVFQSKEKVSGKTMVVICLACSRNSKEGSVPKIGPAMRIVDIESERPES